LTKIWSTERYWSKRDNKFVDIEIETCGNCGFSASIDWWLDYEVDFLKQVGIDVFNCEGK
jgi:hypothetical protein